MELGRGGLCRSCQGSLSFVKVVILKAIPFLGTQIILCFYLHFCFPMYVNFGTRELRSALFSISEFCKWKAVFLLWS